MKWIGLRVTDTGTWVTEVMLTASKRFKAWSDYYLPAGPYAGTWHGNLSLLKNGVGTILRRNDASEVKGIVLYWPSDAFDLSKPGSLADFAATQRNIGAVIAGAKDGAGWDVPLVKVSEALLYRFAHNKSTKGVWSNQAKKEFNYTAKSEDEASSFWAALFAAHIDYPPNEPHRIKIIDTFKKTRGIE